MIDLRSDTLTLPVPGMLECILTAPLGDDGRPGLDGRGEDQTVNLLEDKAAALFGKEAAVFFPTGTLANTAALLTWAKPGQSVLMEPLLHLYKSEQTAFLPQFGQLQALPYALTPEGKPDKSSIRHLLQTVKPALLILENSHNFRGGLCLNASETQDLCDLAHEKGVPVHLDGARIFNAAAATGDGLKDLAKGVDSLMFCLSKGLGAPIGSLICCSTEFAARLRQTRKLLGGVLRQAGVVAAPGLYALTHNLGNAKQDNHHAALFASLVLGMKTLSIPHLVQSNIVMLDTRQSAISPEALCALCIEKGLRIRPILDGFVRLVFHADINREQTEKAAAIILEIDASLGAAPL